MADNLLSIHDLTIALKGDRDHLILKNVSCAVPQGRILGIVGGSGSGKTTLGMAVLGLLPSAMHVAAGKIVFAGQDLALLSCDEMRRIRGGRIGMVFQEPLSAFDPVFTIGAQITETVRAHKDISSASLGRKLLALLDAVGIVDPVRVAASYPHELSGGLRQRAMVAQAIACEPSLLIADEPTSSLDVTLQANIMALLQKVRKDLGITVILISHDLGMVRHLADDVLILSKGEVLEIGTTVDVMTKSRSAYTRALMEAENL